MKRPVTPFPHSVPAKMGRGIEPMLYQCWASVVDGGPALEQHWVDVSCLLGRTGIICQ